MVKQTPPIAFLLEACSTARKAAMLAGERIALIRRRGLLAPSSKQLDSPAADILTQADLESQEIILDTLSQLNASIDLGVLSEEGEDNLSRHKSSFFWAIDPLDGTLPFSEGKDGFSVSIALVNQNGQSVLGVLHDPSTGHTWDSLSEETPQYPQDKVKAQGTDQLHWIMDRSLSRDPRFAKLAKTMQSLCVGLGLSEIVTVNHGGAAMNCLWSMERAHAIYFKIPGPIGRGGSIWDFAAVASMVPKLGGVISSWKGMPLDLNPVGTTSMGPQGLICASNPQIHGDFLKLSTGIGID